MSAPELPEDPPFPPDGDPTWRITRTLRDGTIVTLRPIVPEDAEELRRGFMQLSPRSRYLRFMTLSPEPSANMLHYLTHVDQKNHVAIAATIPSPDLKTERGVGVARFVRLKETDVAEAAITVADDMQRKGLGTILAHELERAARVRGIRTLRAEVHEDNVVVRSSLERAGAVPISSSAGSVAYNLDLGKDESLPPSLPGVFREIAKTLTELLASAPPEGDGERAKDERDADSGDATRLRRP